MFSILFTFVVEIIMVGKTFSQTIETIEPVDDYVKFVPRVVNGWPAKLGDVPYQVGLKYGLRKGRNVFATFCGGTIVSSNKILTAAHCFVEEQSICFKIFSKVGKVRKRELENKYAVAGTLHNIGHLPPDDDTDEGQWRKLKSVYYHHKFDFPKNDIAIAFTRTPFIFNNFVNSIPYASRHADYRGVCLVSGYGRISQYGKMTSDKLLLAHLELVPTYFCNVQHKKNMRHFVCTSSAVTDVGKGDSGGPLVCMNTGDPNEFESNRGILVGIVSGHRVGVGSFFTRVSSFYNYIQRNQAVSYDGKSTIYVTLTILIYKIFVLF